MFRNILILSSLGAVVSLSHGAEIVEITPIHDAMLLLHVKEGRIEHHKIGQKRSDEKVIIDPLNVAAASQPGTYRLSSLDDPSYAAARTPMKVGRKSKGTDFAWFVDTWVDGKAVNHRPDHVKEHWLYLPLPKPLTPGKTYELTTGTLAKNGSRWRFNFEAQTLRSESVHVNTLGYVPSAPQKFGYLYHWAGDLGGVDFKAWVGKPFALVDQTNQARAYEGKIAFRKPKTNPETAHVSDSGPYGNFLNADVYECDFSAFRKPGRYRLVVDGVGASWPFEIKDDVYRPVFTAVTRALYHNRSGIELKKPFTEFTRPAPHNPKLTPGFAGKLMYTSVRMQEWGSEGGDKAKLEAGFKGPLDVAGWYQDAGDWDSYHTHLRVAQELLLAFDLAPKNFSDGDLNIPESGNGIPDILDEAAWLPRFCYRLRRELLSKRWGTGGIGLRIAGDAFGGDGEGIPSYKDVSRIWAASAEDPVSTFRYAGTAAALAHALKGLGKADPEKIDWLQEAIEAYTWADKNTLKGDVDEVRPHKAYAAAQLFRLTKQASYEAALASATQNFNPSSIVVADQDYGPYVYALTPDLDKRNKELAARLKAACLNTATEFGIRTPEKRALRWGGNFYFPMLIGQQTTPWVLEVAMGHAIVRESDPALAEKLRATLYNTCDYMLGTNALNMTWVTGLGPRFPTQIFHIDAWYNGKDGFHPGLIPYSPWRAGDSNPNGPWSQDWALKSIYPIDIKIWPGNEQWFSNRCSPMGSEFTVHQNIGPAAAIFGILCAPRS